MLKTWVEISKDAVHHNIHTVRRLLNNKTKLWAVVKSNAYGHGLLAFSTLADKYGADGFCVDSVIEGIKLRENGIKKPILVLGPTFSHHLKSAANNKITITISNFDALREWLKSKHKPEFHLKIDTGMHRQGFYLNELPKAITLIGNWKLEIGNLFKGIYTHFASAKDINYPTFTEVQFQNFQKAIRILEKAGFRNLCRHCAATGGTLLNKKYHLDAVRIGIGLYGLWPSKELEIQLKTVKLNLKPVLSWRALVSEIKNAEAGDYVGYDLTERLAKPAKIAILPVGYWHGLPRSLSSVGEIIIGGKRAKILGRISMDMTAADITGIICKRGSKATLVGANFPVEEMTQKINTSHYEFLTRINPLIERIIV